MTASLPAPTSLIGRWVRLDPLVESDLPDLATLLVEPAVYSSGYVMHRQPNSLADALALARQRTFAADPPNGVGFGRIAFTVRLTTDSPLGEAGTVVGTSSLGDAHLANESIHLGWTLYGPRWWGTKVNPEAKYLLLRHCFEDLGYRRVKLQTDRLNTRSAAAIVRLGATKEGVLRRDMRREDGTFRDTVVFSILADEWPGVRDGLLARLG
ncbi:MAG TPA: GNAT family protein [Propionicimonas sp.]|nr:GNAT family protein [Propionicimonas sp.]